MGLMKALPEGMTGRDAWDGMGNERILADVPPCERPNLVFHLELVPMEFRFPESSKRLHNGAPPHGAANLLQSLGEY